MHKHLALAHLLRLLTKKERGISYLETHAGRGLYDLGSEETAKTGEADEGISLLSADKGPFAEALTKTRDAHGPDAYPGSPMVATMLLRPQDRIVLMEKHPQEHAVLKKNLRRTSAEVHARDGYEGALAVAPLQPRRGLVLIDPSYEVKTEYAAAGRLARKLHGQWPEATVLIWYPLLAAGRHDELLSELSTGELLTDHVHFDLKGGQGMLGSGLAMLGAPYGSEEALGHAFQQGRPILRRH